MYARNETYRPRTRTLAAMLLLAVLAGCSEDDPTGPDQGLLPETGADAEMEALDVRASAVAHYADGYVWASSPSTASYTPSPFYSYNRSGGANTITRQGDGLYTVRFAGLSAALGSKSTVHVTGYNSDNTYCKATTQKLVSDKIKIKCFDAASGRPTDAYYTVFVTKKFGDLAFAFANKPTGTNYAPLASASHNPTGALRVFRNGIGNYTVRFSGFATRVTANGGHAQVSGLGTGAQHCKVASWGPSGSDLHVNVLCYRRTGELVDQKFNVFFATPNPNLAYVWANQPSTNSYSPSTFYRSNPSGGAVSISRVGVGRYTVTWSGLALLDGGDVQVTAYGGGNIVCKVEGWSSIAATVRCFNPGTSIPFDSFFTILFAS